MFIVADDGEKVQDELERRAKVVINSRLTMRLSNIGIPKSPLLDQIKGRSLQ